MRLTTKGRYAVTAMLDLAIHRTDGPTCLAEISKRQSISLSYLEQLFSRLRQSELVESIRGPGGGYILAHTSDKIFVADIIDSVNETIDATSCGGQGDCNNGEMCLTHHLWEDLSHQIHDFLNGISLANLVERREAANLATGQPNIEDHVLRVASEEA